MIKFRNIVMICYDVDVNKFDHGLQCQCFVYSSTRDIGLTVLFFEIEAPRSLCQSKFVLSVPHCESFDIIPSVRQSTGTDCSK